MGDVCNLYIYESLMHLIIVHELNVLENTKWGAAATFAWSGFYRRKQKKEHYVRNHSVFRFSALNSQYKEFFFRSIKRILKDQRRTDEGPTKEDRSSSSSGVKGPFYLQSSTIRLMHQAVHKKACFVRVSIS